MSHHDHDLIPGPRHARRRRGRLVVPVIACVLVGLLTVTVGYAATSYHRFTDGVTRVDAITPHATSSSANGPVDVDGTAQNILLVGDDHRPAGATAQDLAKISTEDDGGAENTDTMIVLHVPADGKSATMVSFPRDSWVPVPGHGENKLNAAFALGKRDGGGDDAAGARLLVQTIEELSGLHIDHYVRVSLLGFYDVVEALGPVDVCLNQAVKDRWSGVDLPAGVSTLDARQALAFVRQRHGLPRGDLDRQVRQQYFLSVEARQLLSAGTLLNPVKLGRVLDAVSGSMETDADLDFVQLAGQLRGLRPDAITSATIPVLGTPTITVRGSAVSIVEIDFAAMPVFIQDLIGAPAAYTDTPAAAPSTVTVTVANGSGVDGDGARVSGDLGALGFTTGEPTTASPASTTVVEYPAGSEAQAKAVAEAVPGATPILVPTATSVRLVLGSDGVTTASEPALSAPGTAQPDPAPEHVAPAAPEPAPAGTQYGEGACIN
jgi:LCP family protein required for cell wall assembly